MRLPDELEDFLMIFQDLRVEDWATIIVMFLIEVGFLYAIWRTVNLLLQ